MDGSQLRMSLTECAERILGLASGELEVAASGPPLPRLFEALACRNLGLVPVIAPDRFSWPGHWIGVVESGGTRRAVVMFGVPSAPIDATGEQDAELQPVEGYVLAPLDLQRSHDASAYGSAVGVGSVVGIYTAPDRAVACSSHERHAVAAGRGLVGDRYDVGLGTFSSSERSGQDLTLIESEALDQLRDATGIELGAGAARRNIVTRGVRLEPLVGTTFMLGDVRCRAVRLAEPCAHLQRLTQAGVLRGLVHRGGIRADVLDDGAIRLGDRVEPV